LLSGVSGNLFGDTGNGSRFFLPTKSKQVTFMKKKNPKDMYVTKAVTLYGDMKTDALYTVNVSIFLIEDINWQQLRNLSFMLNKFIKKERERRVA
jgi:hypothetical protein